MKRQHPTSAPKAASHESDEEAAATALLMSAGGPPRKEFERMRETKVANKNARSDSTDGKSIVEVFHVSPSSNEGSQEDEEGTTGDHDSIQDEMRVKEDVVVMEDFPVRLHELLTSGDISSIAHWMPSGKSWRVVNWHEFSNVMPSYFAKFYENSRGGNATVMNRMDSFLKEVEVWGFEKEKDDDGVVCYSHEVSTRSLSWIDK